jgi:hypothetical protein
MSESLIALMHPALNSDLMIPEKPDDAAMERGASN